MGAPSGGRQALQRTVRVQGPPLICRFMRRSSFSYPQRTPAHKREMENSRNQPSRASNCTSLWAAQWKIRPSGPIPPDVTRSGAAGPGTRFSFLPFSRGAPSYRAATENAEHATSLGGTWL